MVTLIRLFNSIITGLFNIIFWPVERFDPIWAMIFVSLATGVFMVWIFGKMSNQESIKKVKDNIRGNLIAVRLYQSDLGVVFRLQGRILRDTLTYMRYSVTPMLVLMVPVILIMIQLNLRFSVEPLKVGKPALVIAKVRDASILNSRLVLSAPKDVTVETPPVRIHANREVDWRIRAGKLGTYSLTVKVGDESIGKDLVVGKRWGRVSATRSGNNLLEMLLYPGEPPIGHASPIESIEVRYKPLPMPVFGWNIHWLVLFFILSIVSGFAFKGVLGVEV